MEKQAEKTKWYVAGLHFECLECGRCCSGPAEGYIWVTRPEIELIARHLKMSVADLRRKYLKRVGLRTTVIEHGLTKDCIFLQNEQGRRTCIIYPVRPSQCRSWPFWSDNLSSPTAWNRAGLRCPGISRGRRYTPEQIARIRRSKWWQESE